MAGRNARSSPSRRAAVAMVQRHIVQRWYVVETKYQQEDVAVQQLLNQGFQAYLPKVEEVHGGEVTRIVPLFPGYLFVKFNVAEPHWRSAHYTRGVAKILGTDHLSPTPVREGVVEAIQAEESGRLVRSASWIEELAPETAVRILRGPWARFQGTCMWTRGDRVGLLMELFGRSSHIELDRKDVEKLNGVS